MLPMQCKLSVKNHVKLKKRVPEVLDLVGLKHKMRSFPEQLSGGEQQRVSIARAVAKKS